MSPSVTRSTLAGQSAGQSPSPPKFSPVASPGNDTAVQLQPHHANWGKGPGRPLHPVVQQKMEAVFATSFADVRIHEGPEAASLGALVFTSGNNLYFAPGQYNPNTPQGERVLAHELAHVVQQRAGRVRNPFGSGVALVRNHALEAEAERMAQRATSMVGTVQRRQTSRLPLSAIKGVLQRFAVGYDNLAVEAGQKYDVKTHRGGQGGLFAGSKISHMTHQFTVGGATSEYNMDDWTNVGDRDWKSRTDTTIATVSSNIATYFLSTRPIRKKVRAVLQSWNCERSFIDKLVRAFLLTGENLPNYYKPGADAKEVKINIDDAFQNYMPMVRHLLTMAAALHWREETCTEMSGSVETILNKEEKTTALDWPGLFKAGREKIKEKLQAGTSPNQVPPRDEEDGNTMNKLVFSAFPGANGFKDLSSKGIVSLNPDDTFLVKTDGKNCMNQSPGPFKNALNHARFALWMEWKGSDEVLKARIRY